MCSLRFLKIIGGLLALGMGIVLAWWLFENSFAQIALLITFFFTALVAAFLVGVSWSRETMRDGADIALKAQQVNDAWDARKTVALAALMREGARIGRQIVGKTGVPALPMPDQGGDWLPDLVEFSLSDDNVIEGER
jgi:hypothetical protein